MKSPCNLDLENEVKKTLVCSFFSPSIFFQGSLVSCLVEMLRLMDDQHYTSLFQTYKNKAPLKVISFFIFFSMINKNSFLEIKTENVKFISFHFDEYMYVSNVNGDDEKVNQKSLWCSSVIPGNRILVSLLQCGYLQDYERDGCKIYKQSLQRRYIDHDVWKICKSPILLTKDLSLNR